jgi:hypothetical protein
MTILLISYIWHYLKKKGLVGKAQPALEIAASKAC